MANLFFRADFGRPYQEVVDMANLMGLPTDDASLLANGPLIGLALHMRDLDRLDETGIDWGQRHGRSDVDADIWAQIIPLCYGAATVDGRDNHHNFDLRFGALVELVKHRWPHGSKRARDIVLAQLTTLRRKIEFDDGSFGITVMSGLSLDDDGGIGRSTYCPAYLILVYNTDNDGKASTWIGVSSFQAFAKKHGVALVPTPETMAQCLNISCKHGDAYRKVRFRTDPDCPDAPSVTEHGGELCYEVEFEPQERSRLLIVFRVPLPAKLVRRLRELGLFRLFCERVELAVLGRRGTDTTCFDPVRKGYLPGRSENEYCEVLGPPQFVDAIAIAEQVIAEAPPPRDRNFTVSSMSEVPERLRASLRGVRLASAIADQYPELVHSENNLTPLVLRRCPFCDEHGSKRGQG